MSYTLRPKAKVDLRNIARYSIDQWGKERARTYVEAINQRLEVLASGRLPDRPADHIRPGYLQSAAGRHMIYFRRRPDGTMDVIRILHQSMDVAKQLGGED